MIELPSETYLASENRNLVLFLGAGLSCAAKLDDWKTLKNRMITQLPLSDEDKKGLNLERNYYKCFQWFKNKFPKEYPKILSHSLKSNPEKLAKFKRLFEALLTLKPISIITTNVDDLISNLKPVSDKLSEYGFRHLDSCAAEDIGSKFIFFLHGDLTRNIFTSNDFEDFHNKPTIKNFLTAAFQSNHVLFIGYSFGEERLLEYTVLNEMNQNQQRFRHVALLPSIHESPSIQVLQDLHGIRVLTYPVIEKDYAAFDETIYSWGMHSVNGAYALDDGSTTAERK